MGSMEAVVGMPALLFVVLVVPVYKLQMNWIPKELDEIQITKKIFDQKSKMINKTTTY